MADEEKLIADAFLQAFKKTARLPSDLYLRMSHELKIDDNEPLKVNLTMKRGLVLDIEDDSLFRTFLTIGDIVLTVNDKVACRPEFKLTEAFKDRAGKTISLTYIRLRNYSMEEPRFDEGERREHYEYKIALIYGLQRLHLGMAMEGLNNRVFITSIQPKSLGSLCAAVGDVILHVNGKRVMDTEKTLALISDELEQKSYCKITLERAKTEEARAQVQFAIAKESRDPPLPTDCAAYVEKAMALMKGPEPRSILRVPRPTMPDELSRVGFHDRITTDSVIPSDIPDDALIKTPSRVPNAPGASPTLSSYAPPTPEIDRGELSVSRNISVNEAEAKKGPSKNRVRKAKKTESTMMPPLSKSKESVSTMSIASQTTSPSKSPARSKREWKLRLSTEIFFGRNRKKSGGHKKKKGKNHSASNEEGAHTQ